MSHESLGMYHSTEDAYELLANKAFHIEEYKLIKFVRTAAGMRRYGLEKGSIIIRDGAAPLDGLIAQTNDIPGYEKIADKNGNIYYVGLENGKWVVRNPTDNSLMYESTQSSEALSWLNDKVGGSKVEAEEDDPFAASPNVKPNDTRSRENLRDDLSSPRYNLSVPQASAVDNLEDDQLETYRRNRDRGLSHREAYRETLRAAARSPKK